MLSEIFHYGVDKAIHKSYHSPPVTLLKRSFVGRTIEFGNIIFVTISPHRDFRKKF